MVKPSETGGGRQFVTPEVLDEFEDLVRDGVWDSEYCTEQIGQLVEKHFHIPALAENFSSKKEETVAVAEEIAAIASAEDVLWYTWVKWEYERLFSPPFGER